MRMTNGTVTTRWPQTRPGKVAVSRSGCSAISSASPITSVGNSSGARKSTFSGAANGTLSRASAKAAGTPISSVSAATIGATTTERRRPRISTSLPTSRSYQRSEKPEGGNVMKLSAENEITTTIATGAKSNP
jgi:hypothetical protein